MRFSWWGHAAVWLLFGAIALAPLLQLGAAGLAPAGRFDADGLAALLLTRGQWELLGTSLLLATGTMALAVAIGVPFALLCEKTDLFGRGSFALAALLPLLIPPAVHAIVWGRLLAQNGPVNTFLVGLLELQSAPLDVHGLGGAIFVLAMAYFPFVTLLAASGLKTLDRNCEAAALVQRGPLPTLWHITLPLLRPQIIAGALFVFMFALIDFGVPDILRLRVFPVEIFIQFSALYDERAAALLSLPLLVLAMAVTALLVAAMRNRSYVSLGAGIAAPLRYRLGAWQPAALLFAITLIGLSVAVPLLALLVSAGHWTAYGKALKAAGPSIGFSLLLATGAAALMTLLALFAAVSIQQAREPWRTLLHYLSQVPFAVPAIVLGIGMIRLWNRPATDWLYGTPLIIVLGYCAHYIPFAVRAVHANLLQVQPHLLEAARLAGVTELRLGLRILLPLLRNGLLTAFFITFVLSLGELGVTLLVTPPGTTTIPITIYNYMHYGAEATVSALCLILIAITLLIGIAVRTALRRPIGDAR